MGGTFQIIQNKIERTLRGIGIKMKEKEITKICDYEIKRYYQEGDFFIDLEYHYEKSEVIVYVGDKTDLYYGCVMELASFVGYPNAMRPEPLLNSIEKILGYNLYDYNGFKHYHFRTKLEKIKEEEEAEYIGDYYDPYEYYAEWDYEIQKESEEELSVERFKYGKYIFDFVKHNNPEDGSAEIEVYMLRKGLSYKLLCDKMHINPKDIDFNEIIESRFYKYILAYKKPWQIRLLEPDLEKTFDKSYEN